MGQFCADVRSKLKSPSVFEHCFAGGFMYACERAMPRFSFNVPARVRRLDQIGSTEYCVITSNLSVGGMCFSSEVELPVHTPVRAFLMMPGQIFGEPLLRWRCDGRVVHVTLSGPPGNRLGIGVTFHTYSVLNGARPEPMDQRGSLRLVAPRAGGANP
jgi:hypothetical protein